LNNLDEAIAAKRRKAKRYAAEPDRLTICSFAAELRSDHDIRAVSYDRGKWSCSCEFFGAHGTCSHVLAVDELLSSAGIPVTAPDGGSDSGRAEA
jgi:hypothetical protein